MKFLPQHRMARKRFRDNQRQMAYEDAWASHETLIREPSGNGNAYRKGYETNEDCDKKWTTYPYFLAGRDRRDMDM